MAGEVKVKAKFVLNLEPNSPICVQILNAQIHS
jgi:hypothetical protein